MGRVRSLMKWIPHVDTTCSPDFGLFPNLLMIAARPEVIEIKYVPCKLG